MLVNALGPPPPDVVEKAHEHGVLVGALVGSTPARRAPGRRWASTSSSPRAPRPAGTAARSRTMVSCPRWSTPSGPTSPCSPPAASAAAARSRPRWRSARRASWTGSIWLTVAEADTQPVVVENLLAATSRDTVRSRAMTGKPARQLRSAWTEAWDATGRARPAADAAARDCSSATPPRRISRVAEPRALGLPRRPDRRAA